jgi:hypothetical protein
MGSGKFKTAKSRGGSGTIGYVACGTVLAGIGTLVATARRQAHDSLVRRYVNEVAAMRVRRNGRRPSMKSATGHPLRGAAAKFVRRV